MTVKKQHSPLSASGAERWMNCPGSVKLSEGLPDKESEAAKEGTLAHEILEIYLRERLCPPTEMGIFAKSVGNFILNLHEILPKSELIIETKIGLEFIHPEMFGTTDSAIIDHFGTLHVIDFKYGKGHAVSPKENLQMLFYAIGFAHKYDYNFKRVRMWIIQPRIRGYDGPTFWEISINELKEYVEIFKQAVKRVEKEPNNYTEGGWCFFCKAKGICPLKNEGKLDHARTVFSKIERNF